MLLKSRYSIILTIKLFLTILGALYARVDFKSSDVPWIVADMGSIDNGQGNRNLLTDPFNTYQGKISIELRGSTSHDFSKKQYAIETQNDDGSNKNVSLLGMPAENDWILYNRSEGRR